MGTSVFGTGIINLGTSNFEGAATGANNLGQAGGAPTVSSAVQQFKFAPHRSIKVPIIIFIICIFSTEYNTKQ